MMSELGRRHMTSTNKESSFEDEDEIGLLLREQPHDDYYDREEELNIYRSGSAPPTVEGSLNAVGGLLGYGGGGGSGFQEFARKKSGNGFASEDELMSDPDYLSYYYLNVNLNPRLPPPLLSKEDWRSAKRLQGGSSVVGSDRRMVNRSDSSGSGSRSMLSMPPGFSSKRQEIDSGSEQVQGGSLEWSGDGLIGLGSKQKSFAETFQWGHHSPWGGSTLQMSNETFNLCKFDVASEDDSGQTMFISKAPSRPISRNALDRTMDNLGSVEADLANLRSGSSSQLGGQPVSYSYAAALSRSTTPEPQAIVRAPSPGLPPIGGGRSSNAERRNITSPNPSNNNGFLNDSTTEVAAALSTMSLGNNVLQEENRFPSRIGQEFEENYLFNLQNNSNQQHSYLKSDSGPSGSKKVSSASSMLNNGSGGLQSQYPHLDSPISGYNNLNNYPVNQLNLPPLFENAAAASAMGLPGMDPRMLGAFSGMNPLLTDQNRRFGNPMTASGLQSPYMDQAYPQYLNTDYLASFNDPSADQAYINLLQKVYIEGMLSPHNKVNHPGFYNNRAFGLSYPQSPLASPSVHNGPVSPMRHSGDLNLRYPSGMRNVGGGGGGVLGPWHLDGHLDNLDKNFSSTLLEEFKVNKTMCADLSEIAGHVVEFSADQYGSRFIQQKLENATIEEKDMVFSEISPHALILMTDVFGNYVIQKFFEHGLASQRRELARKLSGKVLSMSLQMYGCRVIQKAIEVVDEDQKIQMVKELDGQVVRCVHDQNGNHVIQKCIECIPEEHIHFIVSTFFGQVVTLSTHSYGCRVIQRVLEHCINPETQSKVMEEILRSVSMLAQDQYGNYVIQHILQHGKPDERSTIIRELAGKIVLMSQQKFASNVVEKCLTYGDSNEVQLLVNEMLGTTDENEPLQAMMKDQFANYVVQKVLETCSDQQRELIMSRIKVHLNALKKYTFGKHIVTRVEKLLATGERKTAESQSMNRAY